MEIDDIDVSTYVGKRLRGEFLFNLRERGGLKYSEIIKMDLFSDLKIDSLGSLYSRTRDKLNKK